MSNSVNRSLYYYDLIWKELHQEERKYKNVRNKKGRFINFLNLFKLEDSKKIDGRYILKTEKGDSFFIITDGEDKDTIEFRIVLCKTNALPLIESEGVLEDLEKYITETQNIAEITHCVFFKESGVIGAEFNFQGARISGVSWYLPQILYINEEIVDEIYEVRVVPKIKKDAYKLLKKNETLSLLQMHFAPDSDLFKEVLADKSLFSGAVQAAPDADVIEIVLKKRKNKKNGYVGLNQIFSKDEIKRIIRDYRDDISKFYVSQGAYSDGIDLLADKLVGKTKLLRTKRRTISTADAYKKIKEFYDQEVRPET